MHHVRAHRFRTYTTRRFSVFAAALVLVSACGGGGDIVAPTCVVSAVAISPTTASLVVGATTQLTATPTSQNCSPVPTANWSSGTQTVATVTANGTVTALTPGSSTISVTVGSITSSAVVTVTPVPVATVTVTAPSGSLNVGATLQATAVLRDGSNVVLTGRNIAWNTSNGLVATVNGSGLITAVGPGAANITATAEGIVGTVAIVAQYVVAAVTIAPASKDLQLGDSFTPTVVLKASDSTVLTGRTVVWSSSNTAIATIVPTTGAITTVSPGSTTISANSEGTTGTMPLYVTPTVESSRFAYAWVSGAAADIDVPYMPSSTYSHNAAGGNIMVTRTATGQYTVVFGKLGKISPNARENVFVTAYGSSGEQCRVTFWQSLNTVDLVAYVRCVNIAGIAVNSLFDIAVIGSNTLQGTYGFIWNANAAASNSGNASLAFSSAGGAFSVTRVSTGVYDSNLGFQSTQKNIAIVSTYGGGNGACEVDSWTVNVGLVRVNCLLNSNGTPHDFQYSALMLEAGRANKRWAFALNSDRSSLVGTPYVPSAQQQNQSNGQSTTITRTSEGNYVVRFTGLGATTFGGTMLVSAYRGGVVEPGPCQVVGWGNDNADVVVTVKCFSYTTGLAADQYFTILAIE